MICVASRYDQETLARANGGKWPGGWDCKLTILPPKEQISVNFFP